MKLAISLAIAAAESGRRVYYGTLGDLIASLEEAQLAGRLLHAFAAALRLKPSPDSCRYSVAGSALQLIVDR